MAPTVSAVPVKGVPASKTSLSGHAKEVNEEGEERDDNDDGEDEDDDADMMALMGFSGFDTTKVSIDILFKYILYRKWRRFC